MSEVPTNVTTSCFIRQPGRAGLGRLEFRIALFANEQCVRGKKRDKTMAQVKRNIQLKASPKTVWEHITDPEKIKKWRNDIIEIKLPGKNLKIGDKYELKKREGKREFEYICTVTAIEEEKEFSFAASSKDAEVKGIYKIIGTDSGTQFEIIETIKLKSFFGKIIEWLFLPKMLNKAIERILHNLRVIIDGEGDIIPP